MSETRAVDTFVAEWEAWRGERDRVLGEPYGILSITSINFLTADPAKIDGIPGSWSTSAAGPVVELAAGEELLDGQARITGRVEFGPLTNGARTLKFGEVDVELFRKDGWDIVRPRDPQAPNRVAFRGTPAYSPDPDWVVAGQWLPQQSSVQIDSIQKRLGGPVDSPGAVEFELGGLTRRLVAIPAHGAPGRVALLFRDATSGVTTYPALRELTVRLPESGDVVALDFNRAANKNCAYTDFAVCPLPPHGNVIDVAIEAGERTPR